MPSEWNRETLTAAGLAAVIAALLVGLVVRVGSRQHPFPKRPNQFLASDSIDKRLADLTTRLDKDPQDVNALTESGILHFQKGKDHYTEALNQLHDARKFGAVDPRIFYYMGVMYQEEGLYPFALEEYRRYLRHYPKDKEIRLLTAKLLYQSGSFNEAVHEFRALSLIHQRDPLILENLGLSLWKSKQLDEARRTLKELQSFGPVESLRASFFLGKIHMETGDYKSAMRDFSRLRSSEGTLQLAGIEPFDIQSSIALTFEKVKLYKEAKQHWEYALAIQPDDKTAKSSLRTVDAALKKAQKKKRS